MLYIAVTPAPVYATLLALAGAALGAGLWRRAGLDRPLLLTALFWIVPLQVTVAALGLAFTAERSIAMRACLTGFGGFWASVAVFGVTLAGLAFALTFGGTEMRARLRPYPSALVPALILQVLVIAVHMRSILLCTV